MIRRSIQVSLFCLASIAAVACGDSGVGDDGEGGAGGEGPSMCPAVSGDPIVHTGAIEADETWSAAAPHVVSGVLSVRAGATLTVEPCAVVEMEETSRIAIASPGTPTTGTIVAQGDEDHPIVFRAQAGGSWGHMLVEAGGAAQLSYVTFEDGGTEDPLGATIVVLGDGTLPAKRNFFVDHVTIRGSKGAGLRMDRVTGFAPGSDALVVTDSGDETTPFPVIVDEYGIDGLPRGDYTGNQEDAILVDANSTLEESGTMRNVGVPYRIGTWANGDLVIGGGSGKSLTTLTIEPGVRLEFFPGTALEIEHITGEFPASGAIVAEGTAAEPIVFTSARTSPAAGDWRGLWFGGIASAQNSMSHVVLEYTGADCGCILVSCSDVDAYEGAMIFSQEPPTAFLSDARIAHGSGHGIVLGYMGEVKDFKAGASFEDMGGCAQTLPTQPNCPNPKPSCME